MSGPSCSTTSGQFVLQRRSVKRTKRCLENEEENLTMPKLSREQVQERCLPEMKAKVSQPEKITLLHKDGDAGTKMRLLRSNVLCNIHTNSCSVPMCGRYFSNIEILAFHMSYSHQDVSLESAATKCLVCGTELESAKGKIAHMTCRHRKLAADHNSQCLDQRVLFKTFPSSDFNHNNDYIPQAQYTEEKIVYDRSTLSDICDMIDIPKDI